ncbi:MAG TPA: SurA N-terminal domain-containing protein, partial [Alphaproteobacteria bacterium]|nr:SurA N-terminal domain-containing protein [Alphaproteobacteria bacterium]
MTASLEMLHMLSWKSLKLCLVAGCFVAPSLALAATSVPTPDVALKPFSAESRDDLQGPRLAIAAIVNDEVISGYDLDQRVKLLTNASGVQPSPDEMQRIRAQVLRELIDEKLKMQEVKRLKVDIKDQEVQDQLNYIASRNNTTPDEIKKQLAKQGISIATLTDQIRAEIAWNDLVQGRFGPDVSIDPNEVKRIMS